MSDLKHVETTSLATVNDRMKKMQYIPQFNIPKLILIVPRMIKMILDKIPNRWTITTVLTFPKVKRWKMLPKHC